MSEARSASYSIEVTSVDHWLGALITYLVFNVIMLGVLVYSLISDALTVEDIGPTGDGSRWQYAMSALEWLPLIMIYVLIFSAVVAVFAGMPLSKLVAWALKSQDRLWVHRVSFILLGAVLGAGTMAVLMLGQSGPVSLDDVLSPAPVAATFGAAVAAWAGWAFTVRRARRRELNA